MTRVKQRIFIKYHKNTGPLFLIGMQSEKVEFGRFGRVRYRGGLKRS